MEPGKSLLFAWLPPVLFPILRRTREPQDFCKSVSGSNAGSSSEAADVAGILQNARALTVLARAIRSGAAQPECVGRVGEAIPFPPTKNRLAARCAELR